ncbi:hypothetical protein FRUB_07188 [Fimbriiglobus ruber]|uniref:Uncharacterized protein n=1 Tax=Fimbriiglobus ruber TaxID=1908690 RepID=A0A225DHQ4_9BACT|nr:hypothetical protein FRUB_07188 [Fimbriiglobus ruber]
MSGHGSNPTLQQQSTAGHDLFRGFKFSDVTPLLSAGGQ